MSDTARLLIAGDLLPSRNNSSFFERGEVNALFDESVVNLFRRADFSIVNLEGPLTGASKGQRKVGPVLKASKQCVNGIKGLGIHCVALANNHFTDYLQEGCVDTINALEEASVGHVGAVHAGDPSGAFVSLDLAGKKICIYNVSESFFNVPVGDGWGANIYDEYLVCNTIRELKQAHDYVLVLYHGGTESYRYPTPNTQLRFHRMADSGADFITAQHTHCIGCHEAYKGCYLLYGQGNFLLDHMGRDFAREGLVTEIVFSDNHMDVKQHLVRIEEGRLALDRNQDLESFEKRSEEILDPSFIPHKFESYIAGKVSLNNKYLQSFKGLFPGRKVLMALGTRRFMNYLKRHYTEEQLSRILFALESDRMREDVACMWRIIDKEKNERD